MQRQRDFSNKILKTHTHTMQFYCLVIYRCTKRTNQIYHIKREYYKNLSNALKSVKDIVNDYNSGRNPTGVYYYEGEYITNDSITTDSMTSIDKYTETKYCQVARLIKNGKSSNCKEWINIELIEIQDYFDNKNKDGKENEP